LTKGISSRVMLMPFTLLPRRWPGNIVNQNFKRMPTVPAIGAAGL